MYGIGVNQNYQTAITYFTQAAEAGNPEGQFNIGAMQVIDLQLAGEFSLAEVVRVQIGGLGVKRDHTKAVQFFTLAAQQVCLNLIVSIVLTGSCRAIWSPCIISV